MSLRKAAFYVVVVVMGAIFAYGFIRFNDGPYKRCGESYCSKTDAPKTAEDYHAFEQWERAIFIVWPIGMIAGFLLRGRKQKPPKPE